jgi:hypothetical protein
MFNNLKLIKSLTPQEVFETWRKIEEPLEHWKDFWLSKGFKSWKDWRRTTHAPLFEKKLRWNLYKINIPTKSVPKWRGGMFHSWDKWFYNSFKENPPQLKDLLTHPGVHNHWYIREIANNFPASTILTALKMPNDDIVIVEGMHRACAITMLAHDNRPLNTEVFVIIANWPNKKPPRLGTGWKVLIDKNTK